MKKARFCLPLLCFLLLPLSSCEKSAGFDHPESGTEGDGQEPGPRNRGLTRRPDGEYLFQLDEPDETLEKIAREARESFPRFIRKLQHPEPGERDFRVKYPLPAEGDSGFRYEQLWLRDISFRDGRYYGVIANEPLHTKQLKAGDRLAFQGDDITDWMYLKDDAIIGGQSIRYLIEQIPPIDRDSVLNAYYTRFPKSPPDELLGSR